MPEFKYNIKIDSISGWRVSDSKDWPEREGTIEIYQLWQLYFDASWNVCNMDDHPDQVGYYPTVQVAMLFHKGHDDPKPEIKEFLRKWATEHFPHWQIRTIKEVI